MEALNDMFGEMERTHVAEALSEENDEDDEGEDEADLSKLVQESPAKESIQDSCFKEVTTKNGTRMVLSVSKTFMKLRDLILEKKTLEEQMEKMNAANVRLAKKVEEHEAKLYDVTGELNRTWGYVSDIKMQHQKLTTSEQVG